MSEETSKKKGNIVTDAVADQAKDAATALYEKSKASGTSLFVKIACGVGVTLLTGIYYIFSNYGSEITTAVMSMLP